MIKPYQLEQLQKIFPIGSRIELIAMDDPYTKLIPGDQGTVTHIDEIGTVFVAWDKGSSLGLVYGEDRYKKVEG